MIEKLKSERGREWLFHGLLLLGIAAFALWQLRHLEGFQWTTDEGIYLMRVRLLRRGYRLYGDIWTDQLPGLIELLWFVFRLAGQESVWLGRALIVLLSLPGLWGTAIIARRLTGRSGALAAVPLVALAPNVYELSRAIVSPQWPSISLGVAALALVGLYTKHRRRVWLVLAGLILALALYIKATAALVIPAGIVWLYITLSERESRRRLWREVLIWGLAAALPLAVALLLHDVRAMWGQFVGMQLASAGMEFKIIPHAVKILRYLVDKNWGLTALGAIGIALAWHCERRASGVLLTWLGTSLFVLLVRSPMWPSQHLVVLLPCLAALAGLAITRVWSAVMEERGGRWERIALLGCFLYALNVPGILYADMALREAPTYVSTVEAVQYLKERVPEDSYVMSDYHMIPYHADLLVPPELATLSKKRIQLEMLGPEQLIAMSEAYDPAAAIMWDEKLADMPGYADWVRDNYALGFRRTYHDIYIRLDRMPGWHEQLALLDGRVRLLGYRLSETAADPGDILRVDLCWEVLEDGNPLYAGFAHLVDDDGASLAQADHIAFSNWHPSDRWRAGERIADVYELEIPDDAASGTYWISVGLYNRETGHRLDATTPEGKELPGDQVALALRPVVRWDAEWDQAPLETPVGAQFGTLGKLVSYEAVLDADADQLIVDLQWEGGDPPLWPSYVAYVHLRQDGDLASQSDSIPAGGTRPTQAWRSGEYIADRRILTLEDVGPGEYGLYVGFYDPDSGERVPVSTAQGEQLEAREIKLETVSLR